MLLRNGYFLSLIVNSLQRNGESFDIVGFHEPPPQVILPGLNVVAHFDNLDPLEIAR
jgi:hypothetical protein